MGRGRLCVRVLPAFFLFRFNLFVTAFSRSPCFVSLPFSAQPIDYEPFKICGARNASERN
jgi:hypothetical protein